MLKKGLPIIVLFILLSQVALVFAQGDNAANKEIDRIETTENSQTIYYKDGTRDMFVTSAVNVHISAESAVSIFVTTPPPFSFPFKEFLEILKDVIENIFGSIGVGCAVLALIIWNRIRGLRNNRPKDYDGLGRQRTSLWNVLSKIKVSTQEHLDTFRPIDL